MWNPALGEPDEGGHGEWSFTKYRSSKKVMNESNHRDSPPRCVKRNLVEILDQNIVPVRPQILAEIPARAKLEAVSGPHAMNIDSVDECSSGRSFPSTRHQIHAVPLRGDTSKNLVKVHLCTARVRRSEEHTSELQSPCNLV